MSNERELLVVIMPRARFVGLTTGLPMVVTIAFIAVDEGEVPFLPCGFRVNAVKTWQSEKLRGGHAGSNSRRCQIHAVSARPHATAE